MKLKSIHLITYQHSNTEEREEDEALEMYKECAMDSPSIFFLKLTKNEGELH